MKDWLKSSQDPEKISNTVKGAVLALSSTAFLLVGIFDVPINNMEYAELATQLGYVAGAIWFVHGLVMKVVMHFGKR